MLIGNIKVIFSDECTVQNSASNPTVWVWRYTHEAYDPKFVNLKDHVKPDISLMVWAAIWLEGKSPLVIMQRDETSRRNGYTSRSYILALEEGLLPTYDGTRPFQQDNAAIHRSTATDAFLLTNAVELIEWPSHSPDLNPIEHIWRALKSQVHRMFPQLSNLRRNNVDIKEFIECLQKAWAEVPQGQVRGLIESMPRRLDACKEARGWYTRY